MQGKQKAKEDRKKLLFKGWGPSILNLTSHKPCCSAEQLFCSLLATWFPIGLLKPMPGLAGLSLSRFLGASLGQNSLYIPPAALYSLIELDHNR